MDVLTCRVRGVHYQNEMVTKTEALKLEVEKVKQLSTEKQKLADDLEKFKKQMTEEKRQMVWVSCYAPFVLWCVRSWYIRKIESPAPHLS